MLVAIDIDRTAFGVLHNQVRQTIGGCAGVEEARNVRMVQLGEDLHLVSEATPDDVAAETGFDQLDRNLLAIVFVVTLGEIDGAHSPASDLAHDAIRADTASRFRGVDVRVEPQQSYVCGTQFHRIVAGVDLLSQQLIDFGTQIKIVGARRIKKLPLATGVQCQRFGEKLLYLLPTFRGDDE
jgi:hypothetical protein